MSGGHYLLRRGKLLDMQGGLCILCNRPIKNKEATLDHIVPRVQGGNSHFINLAVAHGKCNWKRGDKPLNEEQQARIITLHGEIDIDKRKYKQSQHIKLKPIRFGFNIVICIQRIAMLTILAKAKVTGHKAARRLYKAELQCGCGAYRVYECTCEIRKIING